MLTVPGSDSEAAADSESDRRGLPGRHCASDPTRTRGVGLAEQRSAGLAEPRSDGPAVLEVSRSAGLAVSRSGGSRSPGQGGWDDGIPIQQAERDQHKNWFADELVVLVVVNENEKNCSFNSIKLQVSTCTSSAAKPAKRAEVYFLVRVVVMKKAFRSEELFGRGDDEAGGRRPGRLTGPPGLGQSPIAAAAAGPGYSLAA